MRPTKDDQSGSSYRSARRGCTRSERRRAPKACDVIAGRATAAGTRRYASRFPMAAAGHFRELQGLTASSIGLGTYPGRDDESTDHLYAAAITRALACGCNVLDTAVAYRHQRSERIIGRALGDAFARNLVARDEVIIASKAGFLPFDSAFSGGTWSCRGNRDARGRQPAPHVRKCRRSGTDR